MTEVTSGIQIAIILQSLVFIVYFIFLTNFKIEQRSTQFVVALLSLLATHMALNLTRSSVDFSSLSLLAFGLGLLYGPCIFLYIVYAIYRESDWQTRNYVHFVPGVFISVLHFTVGLSSWVGALLTFVSMSIYLSFSFKAYRQYQKTIEQTQSAQDSIALSGVQITLYINLLILILNVLSVLAFQSGHLLQFAGLLEISLFSLLAMSISVLALTELTKNQRFKGLNREEITIFSAQQGSEEVTFSDSEIEHFKLEIERCFTQERIHRDALLNLHTLARKTGLSARKVSQLINHVYGKSFSDLVNQYRIKDVKQLIADAPSENLLDIAFSAGFSTKSNFNRAFKLYEGVTPSEYRRSI